MTQKKKMDVCIDGMTCHSCEILIEQKFREVKGVCRVNVDAQTGRAQVECDEECSLDIKKLKDALAGEKYTVRYPHEKPASSCERPSLLRVLGLFALVFLIGSLFEKLGFFSQSAVPSSYSFGAAVILGLVAGTSSCLAVAGGLMISSLPSFSGRMRPVFLFIVGRVAGYGILGGFIGLVGGAFVFSPFITGGLIIVAAVYMLVMGLDMLQIAPRWIKARLPRMPKSISRRVVDAQGNTHWAAPFFLGAATFFLPCGFTQMLQIYALTTGSAIDSGFLLAGFAIGTAPALIALGWASRSLKGAAAKWFFQFSGALVVVLGFWNIQNGLALAGVVTPEIQPKKSQTGYEVVQSFAADANVKTVNGVQKIDMSLINRDPFYAPSDAFTVKAGVPVRIQVNGVGRGCRSVFQIPKLGVSEYLDSQVNVVEFTPKKAGKYVFSCGMGMYRGMLTVI